MTTSQIRPEDMLQAVDREKGLIDRRIFVDQDIYEVELKRIFARAWNFMAHDSQIPNPGDFFMTYIGEDRVIAVRDNDGNPQVLVNTCRHRGNAICRADEGHATSFMCTYHGWTYDLKGALVGVPGFKEVYHEELDRENWGLIKAAQVDSYHGFIFATMDPEAIGLNDYLGDAGRLGIDLVAVRGNIVMAAGVQKWIVPCNWKIAVDNVWDFYHAGLTHSSAYQSGWQGRLGVPSLKPQPVRSFKMPMRVVLGEYGHAHAGLLTSEEQIANPAGHLEDQSWRDSPEAQATLGRVGSRVGGHPHIFPNLWFMPYMNQISLRLPKGPLSTEIWWFTFYYEHQIPGERYETVRRAIRHNGPSGMFELEDGENWGDSTWASRGREAIRHPLNYSLNIGRGEITEEETAPAYIDSLTSEHGQMWHYTAWAEWMAAESWPALQASHSKPTGTI